VPKVPLGDVAAVHGGGRLRLTGDHFVEQGVPAYGAGGLKATSKRRSTRARESCCRRSGRAAESASTWTAFGHRLRTRKSSSLTLGRVDPRFLWHQLNDERRWHRSGTGQPFIKPADVKANLVWLPHLDEQRQIARSWTTPPSSAPSAAGPSPSSTI
jgi:hypothetical protein